MLELYSFAYGGTMERDRDAADLHELLARPSAGERWGTRLNYVRRGSGDLLLLLHSLGGSLVQWSPVIDVLAAERDVVAVDMPGFGDSPPLPEGVVPTAANLATAVLDFYESLEVNGPLDVAGISLGGWTAIECARQDGARSVVALSPAGFWRRTPAGSSRIIVRPRHAGRALRPLLRPLMWTARGRRWALGRFMRHPERLTPAEAFAVAEAYVTAPAYTEASALMLAGRVEDMKGINVPVTLGWAEYDTLVRNRPLPTGVLPSRVRQVELAGCGHVPTWDDPDLVARVVLEGTSH